jgi:hypothetical protein
LTRMLKRVAKRVKMKAVVVAVQLQPTLSN